MSEIFKEFAVIGDAVSKEDGVVHLLASLPESYNVSMTAFEAQSEKSQNGSLLLEAAEPGVKAQRKGHYTLGRWS